VSDGGNAAIALVRCRENTFLRLIQIKEIGCLQAELYEIARNDQSTYRSWTGVNIMAKRKQVKRKKMLKRIGGSARKKKKRATRKKNNLDNEQSIIETSVIE
jgi:hypothetical protein